MIHSGYFVGIFGGGVAGVEAAHQFSKRKIYSVLFEQNNLPYGKIEEGLPKWHIKLRDQEERKIDEKFSNPYIHFVPGTKLGADITFKEIIGWGFNAIILAIGAQRDRRLAIADIDQYIGKGLYYQNQFVSWFNHHHEPDFTGPHCEIFDNAIVVGGGLASMDVVKILMLETTLKALNERNYKVDIFTLEREGIGPYLKSHGLKLSDLGLKGCTLFYRKRIEDMPLAPMPPDLSIDRKNKIYQLRKRILKNFQAKFMFGMKAGHSPIDKIVEDKKLKGLIFKKKESQNGEVYSHQSKEVHVRSPLVLSSIGSRPDIIPEIPFTKELLSIENSQTGQLQGFQNVFAIGNAVTGRGNIKESLRDTRRVSQMLIDDYLEWQSDNYEMMIQRDEAKTSQSIDQISKKLASEKILPIREIKRIIDWIQKRQKCVGYTGDYHQWITNNRPIRLEDLIK
jgi:hypothetical protein